MGLAEHSFLLDTMTREQGIVSSNASLAFFRKLDQGLPVTVGMLGASVAENSGCLTQPGKRCMQNSGRGSTLMAWGEPLRRPYKGFLVRFFEWLNASWPHPEHQLFNAGRDASSMATIVPCLFSHVPPHTDLVLIEGGSMLSNPPSLMETIVRQLVSTRNPPVVLFVTVHMWCTFGGSIAKRVVSYGHAALPDRVYAFFDHIDDLSYMTSLSLKNETRRADAHGKLLPGAQAKVGRNGMGASPSDNFVNGVTDLCRRYPVDCISQHDALGAGFRAGRPGFAIQEIAGDCLHPFYGTHGAEYMTDLLVHWATTGYKRWDSMRSQLTSTIRLLEGDMPPPVNPKEVAAYESKRAACYHLAAQVDNTPTADAAALPWRTATCSSGADVWRASPEYFNVSLGGIRCPAREVTASKCPSRYHLPTAGANDPSLPQIWTYCPIATVGDAGGTAKPSPGVAAFVPGAALAVALPTGWLKRSGGISATTAFNVTLQHLTSWNSMGIAHVSCWGTCTCMDHVVDGHAGSNDGMGKVTVFTEHTFEAALSHLDADGHAKESKKRNCEMRVLITNTSSSGGHMFKIRDILLHVAANPCDVDKLTQHFLAVRSHLSCATKVPKHSELSPKSG